MTDPAIEAAQRVWIRRYGGDGHFDRSVRNGDVGAFVVDAAREVLKPIRELHKPEVVRSPDDEQWTECTSCYGAHWPCDTAKLIYRQVDLHHRGAGPMSNTDRIAEILRESLRDVGRHLGRDVEQKLARDLHAELHPVIETVEQLDALPEGAVIRTDEGRVAVKSGYSWGNASGYASWWSTADEEEFDCQSDELDDLPATVLYTPEADRG